MLEHNECSEMVNLFYKTVNSKCYATPLFDQMTEDEKPCGYLMQDNATFHKVNDSINVLAEGIGKWAICQGLWPSH